MGRSPRHANVALATGLCMLGFSFGPVTGRRVAEICAGDPSSIDIAPLCADRF
jgi:D-amino-acid dehydrogenase